MLRPLLLLVLLALLPACGGDDRGAVTIETAGGEARVDVEVADSPEERRRGLMGRESLAPEAGMLFVFGGEHRGGFWMKDTLVPLSIAFMDGTGRVVAILDMEPCRADPCPLYDPGVPYESALEVNRGAFADWGVEVGDAVAVELP